MCSAYIGEVKRVTSIQATAKQSETTVCRQYFIHLLRFFSRLAEKRTKHCTMHSFYPFLWQLHEKT